MEKNKKIKEYKDNNSIDIRKIINDYNGYVYKICKTAYNKHITDADVEEIATDTFFILWKNREKLEDEKLITPYIAGITRNLIREKLRKITYNEDITEYENLIPDLIEIDMICEDREKILIINEIIKKMKVEDINLFRMYYFSAMKIKDISKKLGISEISIKSRLYRIRKKLKSEVNKGGYNYGK